MDFEFAFDIRSWLFGIQWNGPQGCYRAVRISFGPFLLSWTD